MRQAFSSARVRSAHAALRIRRRRAVAGLMMSVVAANSACYAYVPAQTTAQPGEHVGLLVTDEGRVALRDQMGAGVDRIEGILLDTSGEEYLLQVAKVRNVGGTTSHWTGEHIRIRPSNIARVETRKVSGRKTALTVGGIVVGAALLFATNSLSVFGFENEREPRRPPDPADQ
jgi:hypothetical protein